MAAIARRRFWALLLGIVAPPLLAQNEPDARALVGGIARALTDHDPSAALSVFSKSLPNRSDLRDYFNNLTEGYDVVNEVDFVSSAHEGALVREQLHWSITFSGKDSGSSTHRTADVSLAFTLEKNKWKIVEFKPLDLFDPTRGQ